MANQCEIKKIEAVNQSKEIVFLGDDPLNYLTYGKACTVQQKGALISCLSAENPLHYKSVQITDSYTCSESALAQLGTAIQFAVQPQVNFFRSLFFSQDPFLSKVFQNGIPSEQKEAILEIKDFCKKYKVDFSQVVDSTLGVADSSFLQTDDGKIAALRAVATLLSLRTADENSFYFSKIPPSQEDNQKFIDRVLKLIEEKKVHLREFERSQNVAAAVGATASYKSAIDSVQISSKFSLSLADRATLIHEFYHFYQDAELINDESYIANEFPAYLKNTQYVLHELKISQETTPENLMERIKLGKVYSKGEKLISRVDKINPEIAALWVSYDRYVVHHQEKIDQKNLEKSLEQGAILIEIAAAYPLAIGVAKRGLLQIVQLYANSPADFNRQVQELQQDFSIKKKAAYELLKERCEQAKKENKTYVGRDGAFLKMPIQDYARIAVTEILLSQLLKRLNPISSRDEEGLQRIAMWVQNEATITQEDADSIAEKLTSLNPFSYHIFMKNDGVK